MKQLSAWMKDQGIKQPEAAKRLGISQAYLSNILAGKMKPGGLLAITLAQKTKLPLKLFRPDLFG